MVSLAQNRGQRLEKVEEGKGPAPFVLASVGDPPVQTLGKPSETPTRVMLDGKNILQVYLKNGTWELVVDLDKKECLVACDTPNVRFALDPSLFENAAPGEIKITKYSIEYGPSSASQTGCDFIYPGFAKYVRLGK